jgi:hypothetical protein
MLTMAGSVDRLSVSCDFIVLSLATRDGEGRSTIDGAIKGRETSTRESTCIETASPIKKAIIDMLTMAGSVDGSW